MYADDLTIYLTPNEQNLKYVLKIIKNFYHLSCLKISVSKTKAIWFGKDAGCNRVLCPEEQLVWTEKFTLLGLDFDSKLEQMDQNYFEKIKDIEKLLQGWLYRHLSPYGKIVIIKSLALSKLSHIALVVPSLGKKELQKLETIFFSFLWSNKNAKVAKIDTFKPLNKGGLAMVDISAFWQSLKCSWVRRLLTTDAFWPRILDKNLEQCDIQLNQVLFKGPSFLLAISKKIKNKFWQHFLSSLSNLQKEASYAVPENFYLFSVFNNPLFKKGNKCLKRCNFGNESHVLEQVADFFESEGQLYNLAEINAKYGTSMTNAQLSNIQHAITSGLASLNLNIGKCTWHQEPRQSILIQIACRNKKGCRGFYNTFRARANQHGDLSKCENKWHTQLNCNLSVNFWDQVWRLHASIKYNNPFKWIQCQILRNSIYTNNRVSKFKRTVSDQCDFCHDHIENALTLFWLCQVTQQFWGQVKLYLADFTINVPVSRLEILFGVAGESYDSKTNTAIMIGKRVIWASKHKKTLPSLTMFKKSLKDYLLLLKYCHAMSSTNVVFDDQWDIVLRDLDNDLVDQQQHVPQLPPTDVPSHGQLVQTEPVPDLLWPQQGPQYQPHPHVHHPLQQDDDQAG